MHILYIDHYTGDRERFSLRTSHVPGGFTPDIVLTGAIRFRPCHFSFTVDSRKRFFENMRVSSTVLLSLVFQIVSSRFRLPYDVRPIQYTITLKPDIDAGTFYGESAIDIVAENDRDELLIHACGLNVTHSSIDRTSTMLAERKDEMLAIWIENGTITAGNHTLRFRYFGFLRESLGLVKAAYGTNNYSGYLVVNDFEPDGARWAFPCFDEPRFKANFAIRLIAPNATYTALSNMPRVPASWGDTYDFVTSVKMSTYTVSFVITDYPHYEHVATLPNRTVPVRIYAHNATRINTEVVVGAATAAIKFYSDYTGIDYQLPKLDMIEYNQTGNTASEYWGLIHFKQGLLTSDFDVFDDWQRRLVVSHELAHFWFGNLVTNEWWEDLWLQEGMATFMSYKFMSEVYESPNIHIDVLELFVVEKSGAKPLFYNLTSRNDTEDRFDKVVYEKAALLLKNLECLVGPDTFRKSVMEYLDKNAYGTISTGQFVSLFEINSAQPLVRAYLESFLCQRGFPVVSVREVNATCYVITQDIYIDEHRQVTLLQIIYCTGWFKFKTTLSLGFL
ncbi:leucyl-cystinyl aminopeptidase-like [Cylas formicarius]|uniref:leucyl-cystinyl aminopeptidase-like n=1 Tax=Cylas formicarius TaxID=197179 RepID=UPI0029583225|nr:leucyl-cystinyl aminopeptidase-like [Cylas formicarius]